MPKKLDSVDAIASELRELSTRLEEIPEASPPPDIDDLMRTVYRALSKTTVDDMRKTLAPIIAKDAENFVRPTTKPAKPKADKTQKRTFQKRKCLVCAKEFMPRGPTHRYCSDEHRDKAQKKARKCAEKTCGKRFIPKNGSKYCCKTHANRTHTRNYREKKARKK